MRSHVLPGLLLLLFLPVSLLAAETGPQRQPLGDYLATLEAEGARIIYSSDLVSADALIVVPPAGGDVESRLSTALRPLGLAVRAGPAGSLLIVRADISVATPERAVPVAEVPIPEIIVTSSLHRLQYTRPQSSRVFDKQLVERIPVTGEETARLAARLPGTANGGISSKTHVRGGEDNEVLFLFDGLRLYEPYHLRDFQSVATIVNPGAIGGFEFYTGAYPAHYGDRMSGVMTMAMREPEKDIETELGLSFFNASLVSLGEFGERGDWLVSARRGNLDLVVDVVDPDRGSPDYNDVLGHVGWEFGPRTSFSANLLLSHDKIRLVDGARGEEARAAYSNSVGWLTWEAAWTDRLESRTMLAASDIEDERVGVLMLPGIASGSLDDARDLRAYEIRQDWTWVLSDRWMWSFGANLKHLDAEYRHISEKFVESPFDGILGNTAQRVLDFDIEVDGGQYAAYSELRWRATERIVLDLGLRWDQQTYPIADDDRQFSPRASVLYQPGPATEVRLGWGQYYQAQETNELQLADGVADFFPAQRAEHFVLNWRQAFANDLELDVSVFRKSFRTLRPRFENVFNTLTLVPELQFDRIMIDPDKAESLGAEVTLAQGTGDDAFLWWASYAWARTRDWSSEGKVPRSWDQTHSVKAGLSWRRGSWDTSAAAEVHTGWPRTALSSTQSGTLDITMRNALRFATFASIDVRLSRRFDVRRGELSAYLDIANALDRRNACCTEYSIDASDGSLRARTRHWLPLVPSLGIIWRF